MLYSFAFFQRITTIFLLLLSNQYTQTMITFSYLELSSMYTPVEMIAVPDLMVSK